MSKFEIPAASPHKEIPIIIIIGNYAGVSLPIWEFTMGMFDIFFGGRSKSKMGEELRYAAKVGDLNKLKSWAMHGPQVISRACTWDIRTYALPLPVGIA